MQQAHFFAALKKDINLSFCALLKPLIIAFDAIVKASAAFSTQFKNL